MAPLARSALRFRSRYPRVCDGHDLAAMREALAPGASGRRWSCCNTVKGHGVPEIEGRMECHYLPLDRRQQYAERDGRPFEVAGP